MSTRTADQIREENIKLRNELALAGPRASAIILQVLAVNEVILLMLSPSNVVHVDFKRS